jgi:hypothetical protein
MNRSLTILSIFVGLMLLDWTVISHRPSALAVEVWDNNCVHAGRIISVQGQVQLRRKDWSDYHPTAVGAQLCLGDLLLPAKGTEVVVQCADPSQDLWTVPEGQPSGTARGCRPPKEPIHTLSKPLAPSRELLASGIPNIISPKKTWLMDDKPTLRWIKVPGAVSYVVRVSGPGVNWNTEVTKTEVVYPGKPPLKPGEGYLLTVWADNGETPARAIFGLLDGNKAVHVRAAKERVARQNLNDEAKALAIAEVYIGQGLIAEATELLEALVAKGTKAAAVYHMLGDLYAQVDWLRRAQSNYLQAVDLATTAKDIEGQAAAAARLAEVEEALGNLDTATYWRKQAQKGYQALLALKPATD